MEIVKQGWWVDGECVGGVESVILIIDFSIDDNDNDDKRKKKKKQKLGSGLRVISFLEKKIMGLKKKL